MISEKIYWALWWSIVGDALWVPYEFMIREDIEKQGGITMKWWWNWQQPVWTWSDDSSLILCLVDSLCSWYDLIDITKKFVAWKKWNIWNAHDYVFDIGWATERSLFELERLLAQHQYEKIFQLKNNQDRWKNGNGALMRILPLLFIILWKSLEEQWNIIEEVWSLTHPHDISNMGCMIYLKIWENILHWYNLFDAYIHAIDLLLPFFITKWLEIYEYDKILDWKIHFTKVDELYSTGYVVRTLEVVLFCLLNTENYKDAVCAGISFGADTDTVACILWWLSWLFYGYDSIPEEWISQICKKEEIDTVIKRFSQVML